MVTEKSLNRASSSLNKVVELDKFDRYRSVQDWLVVDEVMKANKIVDGPPTH
jgi:hypothetical protein